MHEMNTKKKFFAFTAANSDIPISNGKSEKRIIAIGSL